MKTATTADLAEIAEIAWRENFFDNDPDITEEQQKAVALQICDQIFNHNLLDPSRELTPEEKHLKEQFSKYKFSI